jgi:hypothetical protein
MDALSLVLGSSGQQWLAVATSDPALGGFEAPSLEHGPAASGCREHGSMQHIDCGMQHTRRHAPHTRRMQHTHHAMQHTHYGMQHTHRAGLLASSVLQWNIWRHCALHCWVSDTHGHMGAAPAAHVDCGASGLTSTCRLLPATCAAAP